MHTAGILALSRSDRRALSRALAKPPKKTPKSTPIDPLLSTQPWKVRAVLDPLDSALHDMLSKGLDVIDGNACFRLVAGPTYALAPAIEGVLAAIEIAKIRHGWQIDASPLERVMRRLYADAVLFEHDIHDARRAVGQLYPLFFGLRVTDAGRLARDAHIKCELGGK